MAMHRTSTDVNNSSAFKTATLFGQAIGAIALGLGFAFFLLGLTGVMDLIVEARGINARLINGSPGVVFILVGFLILWRYKPKHSLTTTEERVSEPLALHSPTTNRERDPRLERVAIALIDCESASVRRKLRRQYTNAERKEIDYLISNPDLLQNRRILELVYVQGEDVVHFPRQVHVETYRRKTTSDRAMSSR